MPKQRIRAPCEDPLAGAPRVVVLTTDDERDVWYARAWDESKGLQLSGRRAANRCAEKEDKIAA